MNNKAQETPITLFLWLTVTWFFAQALASLLVIATRKSKAAGTHAARVLLLICEVCFAFAAVVLLRN